MGAIRIRISPAESVSTLEADTGIIKLAVSHLQFKSLYLLLRMYNKACFVRRETPIENSKFTYVSLYYS